MDVENINKQIQAEKDSYNRDKNRLQQELLTLKQRHHRNMEYLKRQKEQVANKNKYEQVKQFNSSESIFKTVGKRLNELL